MKRAMLALASAALLCGCSSTREVYTSEGAIVYAVSCQLQSYESCIEKAGEWCGTLGYRIVQADGSPAPVAMPPEATPPRAAADEPGATPAAAAAPPAGFALSRKYYIRCHS